MGQSTVLTGQAPETGLVAPLTLRPLDGRQDIIGQSHGLVCPALPHEQVHAPQIRAPCGQGIA